MDPFTIGSLALGGLNLASNAFTSVMNYKNQKEAQELSKENLQFQKDQYAWNQQQYLDEKQYSRDLQQQMFNREDTSYQRTVDDIQKSGLSPLAINGTNQSGQVVSAPSAPNIPELSNIAPAQMQQISFGQLADALAQADTRQIERERLELDQKRYLSEKEYREAQATEQTRQFNEQLNQQVNQMNQQNEQFLQTYNLEATESAKRMKQIDESISNMNRLSNLESSKAKNEEIIKNYAQLGGECEYFSDKDKYEKANATFTALESEMLKDAQKILNDYTSEVNSKSKNVGGGFNLGLPKKVEMAAEKFGLGGTSIGASGDYSNSEAKSYSQDVVARYNAKKEAFYKSHKKPILWVE